MEASSQATGADARPEGNFFDIESYISNYDTKSNITLQRLLFLSRTVPNKDASKRGFYNLERLLKSKGDIQMYRKVFGPTNQHETTADNIDGDDDEEMMEIDNDGFDRDTAVPPAGSGSASAEIVPMDNETTTAAQSKKHCHNCFYRLTWILYFNDEKTSLTTMIFICFFYFLFIHVHLFCHFYNLHNLKPANNHR